MLLNLKAAYLALQTVPFLALVPALPYTIRGYLRTKSVNVWRCTYFYSFVLYMLCAYFMTILPIPTQETLQTASPMSEHLQLIPFDNFASIKQETLLRDIAVLLFNVVLTLPLGFYLRALYGFDIRKTALAGFGVALFFEVSQLTGIFFIFPRPWRIFDVDDLMINTLGAVVGYVLTPWISRLLPGFSALKKVQLSQGSEVSFSRRFLSGSIDIFLVVSVSMVLSGILSLLIGTAVTDNWKVLHLSAFAFVMLVASVYSLICGHITLGNRMTGLHLTTDKGKPASRLQSVKRMLLEHICVTAVPFWVYFSIRISADKVNLKNVLWLSVGTFLMLCAARNILEMMFNAVTHGSSMCYDRLSRTHLSYGNSKKPHFGIRVLDIIPLEESRVDSLSQTVCDALLDAGFASDTAAKVCLLTESILQKWMDDGLRGTPCEVRLDKHLMQKTLILSIPVAKNKFHLEAAIEESHVDVLGDKEVQLESYCAAEKKVCLIRLP